MSWLVVLCWVIGCAGGAFAWGQSAPLSPEFLRWREEAARGRDRTSGPAERPTGYIPSPVDLSHLDGADYSRFLDRRSDRGDALPVSYDLRAEGRVTPVRDQGPFGTCWSFAAIGAAESSCLTQKFGGTPDLSEMHLAWFTYREPGKGFTVTDRQGNIILSPTSSDVLNRGGNNFKSAATLARWTGAVSEDSLPYKTVPDKPASDYPNRLHLRDVFYLGRDRKKPDDAVWKTLIREYGAISIAYCDAPQYYTSGGVSFYNSNSSDRANHQVLAVGWDDNYPKDKFKEPKPAKDGAWLVKNSWGKGFGKDGYFWISYEDKTLEDGAVYRVAPADPSMRRYGYDDLGWCSSIRLGEKGKGWMANVFTAKGDETLKAVSFYTTAANARCTLRVYRLGAASGTPVSGTLVYAVDGEFPFAGYHTVDLTAPVPLETGERFSVVLRMETPGYQFPLAVEVKVKGYSDNAVCNPGESYFSGDGVNWEDGFKEGINACIKAFTRVTAPALEAEIEPHTFAPGLPYQGTVRVKGVASGGIVGANAAAKTPGDWSTGPVAVASGDAVVVTGTVSRDVPTTVVAVRVTLGGGAVLSADYTLMKKLAFVLPETIRPAADIVGGEPYSGLLTVRNLVSSDVASVEVVPSSLGVWEGLTASLRDSTVSRDTDVVVQGTPKAGFGSSILTVTVTLKDGRSARKAYTVTERVVPPTPGPTPG
ncbi:MAG: lectin like domain-containing protein, partial [Fretibacterium sp.]